PWSPCLGISDVALNWRNNVEFRQKEAVWRQSGCTKKGSAGPIYTDPAPLPPANPVNPRGRAYCTTVTARRFCDQHEISLQIATGRSFPNDFEVIRPGFTPLLTR